MELSSNMHPLNENISIINIEYVVLRLTNSAPFTSASLCVTSVSAGFT
jgi:hypothetical protein